MSVKDHLLLGVSLKRFRAERRVQKWTWSQSSTSGNGPGCSLIGCNFSKMTAYRNRPSGLTVAALTTSDLILPARPRRTLCLCCLAAPAPSVAEAAPSARPPPPDSPTAAAASPTPTTAAAAAAAPPAAAAAASSSAALRNRTRTPPPPSTARGRTRWARTPCKQCAGSSERKFSERFDTFFCAIHSFLGLKTLEGGQ